MSDELGMSLKAKQRVLSDLLAIVTIEFFMVSKLLSFKSRIYPFDDFIHLSQASRTIYDAPFRRMTCLPFNYSIVLILFLSELKGNFLIDTFFYLSSR